MSNLLSNREKEVLELIAYENTNDEIAEKLYISNHTVKTHRKNLLEKLLVKNTAGLVRRGFELGLLQLRREVVSTDTAIRPINIGIYDLAQKGFQGSLHELYSSQSKSAV